MDLVELFFIIVLSFSDTNYGQLVRLKLGSC